MTEGSGADTRSFVIPSRTLHWTYQALRVTLWFAFLCMQGLNRKDKPTYKQAPPHLLCETKTSNAEEVAKCY